MPQVRIGLPLTLLGSPARGLDGLKFPSNTATSGIFPSTGPRAVMVGVCRRAEGAPFPSRTSPQIGLAPTCRRTAIRSYRSSSLRWLREWRRVGSTGSDRYRTCAALIYHGEILQEGSADQCAVNLATSR